MKASFWHRRGAEILLETRSVTLHEGLGIYTYTLVFSPRTHTFAVSVSNERGAARLALGSSTARAAAIFEALVVNTVAPCHLFDVAEELLEA